MEMLIGYTVSKITKALTALEYATGIPLFFNIVAGNLKSNRNENGFKIF